MTVYQDPNRLPAGILALLVHVAFFTLLYFGVSWQTQRPAVMSVELWQSLPDVAPAPPVKAKVVKVIPIPEKVEAVLKPDIVIPDKKPKLEAKPVEKPPEKPPEKKPEKKPEPEPKPEVKKPVEVKKAVNPAPQKPRISAAEQQAQQERAAQEAAVGRVVDEYTGKISGKIRHNIVMPPNVADDARAEFSVTVLPGGTVLPPRLLKSSGNVAYDNAVERAILKSQPLPLPADAGLFNRFRELRLGFKPVE